MIIGFLVAKIKGKIMRVGDMKGFDKNYQEK